MMSEWEKVESLPPAGRPRIDLEPGEIRRRITPGRAGPMNRRFKQSGRDEYHASERVIDGVRWVYIWRDPLP